MFLIGVNRACGMSTWIRRSKVSIQESPRKFTQKTWRDMDERKDESLDVNWKEMQESREGAYPSSLEKGRIEGLFHEWCSHEKERSVRAYLAYVDFAVEGFMKASSSSKMLVMLRIKG